MSQKSSSSKFYKSSLTKLKISDRLKSSVILPELPSAKYLQLSDKETIKTRVFSEFATMKLKADKESHSVSQRKFNTIDQKDQSRSDQSQLLLSTLGILNTSSTRQLPKDITKLKNILSSSKTMEKLSLGLPATREDTTQLADWLNSMLKTALHDNNQNIESLCETAMLIYEVCLYEIVRQVSVHCIERGELINLVWKAYMGILEKALKISKAVQELQKAEFSEELEKITKGFSKQLENLHYENSQLNEDLTCLRSMVKTREEECSQMARKEVKIVEKVHVLQKQYENTKRELLYLQEDNRIMKAKLFNSSVEFVENSQGVIEPRLVSIQKIKRRSEAEIMKIANSDPLLSAQMVSDEKTDNLMKSIEKYEEYTKELMNQVDFLDKNEATENLCVDAEVQTDKEWLERYSTSVSGYQLMELKVENVMDIFEDEKEEDLQDEEEKQDKAEQYLIKFQEKINQVNEFLDKVKANIQKNSPAGIQKDMLKTFFNSVQESITSMEQEQDKEAESLPFERKKPRLLTFIQKIDKTEKKETRDLISLITQKVLQTPAHKLKSIVFKRMLMKLITSFYEAKQKKISEGDRKQNMTQIVTEMLYNKYGMPKVVENKYVQLLSSCIKYKSIKRVHNFGKFLRLYDNFSLEDLNFYMDSVTAMKQTHFSENGEELKIHFDKALDWCKNFLPSFLPSADRQKIKVFIENFKQVDPVTRVPTVEVDALLENCIEIIHRNRLENSDFLMSIYEAGDLNQDGFLQYHEFELIYRHIVPGLFSESQSTEMFKEFAETFTGEDEETVEALSFENFSHLNEKHSIFTPQRLGIFISLSGENDYISKETLYVNELKKSSKHIAATLSEMRWRYFKAKNLHNREEMLGILDLVQQQIKQLKKPQAILIALKLMDEESKRACVLEAVNLYIPQIAFGFNNELKDSMKK